MDSASAMENKSKSEPSGDQLHSTDYAPYPKLDPADVAPPPPPPPAAAARSGGGGDYEATTMPAESNPYVTPAPAAASSSSKLKDVLGRWGKNVGEAAKKTEDLAGNVWQHLKTGPSVAEAAMGRIAQGTKVLAEGGYDKIFRQTFETLPEEQLKKSYACYLSTSAGPVMGILYLSTAKLAFCSDIPLSYKVGDQTEWSYYKAYHRDILEQRLAALYHHPQPSLIKDSIKEPVKELPKRSTSDMIQDVSTTKSTPSRKQSKRGRERKSGSRKHRPRGAANIRDPNSF